LNALGLNTVQTDSGQGVNAPWPVFD
jgi:hypothetical protein